MQEDPLEEIVNQHMIQQHVQLPAVAQKQLQPSWINQTAKSTEEILFLQKKLVYLLKQEFLKKIMQYVRRDQFEQFSEIFSMESQNSMASQPKQIEYIYPFVEENQHLSNQIKINLFISEYVIQYDDFSFNGRSNFLGFTRQKSNSFNGHSEVRTNSDKKSERTKSLKQVSPNHIFFQNSSQEDPLKLKINNKIWYSVPLFLKKKSKAYNTLISKDYSQHYQVELAKVKKLIFDQFEREIRSQSNALLSYYISFLKEYIQFQAIKEEKIKCDQSFTINTLIHQKNVYDQKSYLSQAFKNISQLLPKKVKQKIKKIQQNRSKKIVPLCKQILQHGLQRVRLYSSNSSNVYGCNSFSSIYININHQDHLTQHEFRNGPLKSYLYLVIIHQLGHFLIRSIHQFNVQEFDRSFAISSKDKTFGEKFIQIFMGQNTISRHNSQIRLKQKNLEVKHNEIALNCQNMQKRTKQLRELYGGYKNKLFNQKFYQIKEIIQIYHKSKKNLCFDSFIEQVSFLEDQWENVYSYIDQLAAYNNGSTNSTSSQAGEKQKYYRLFFAIFLSQTSIVYQIYPFLQKQQRYLDFRNKLINLKINRYFIKQNETIQKFIKICGIHQQKVLAQLERYSFYVLQCNLTYTSLRKKMLGYFQEINNQLQNSHIFEKIQRWKNAITKYYFQIYSIEKYIQEKQELFFLKRKLEDSLFGEEQDLKDNIGRMFDLEAQMEYFSQFLQYFELYKLIYQLPSFFNPFFGTRKNQSGYDIERRIFPNLKDKIYAEDYIYIQKIEDNNQRQRIGKRPQTPQEDRLFVATRQSNKETNSIDCSARWCRTQQLALIKEKKEQMQEKLQIMKKNLAQVMPKKQLIRSFEEMDKKWDKTRILSHLKQKQEEQSKKKPEQRPSASEEKMEQ